MTVISKFFLGKEVSKGSQLFSCSLVRFILFGILFVFLMHHPNLYTESYINDLIVTFILPHSTSNHHSCFTARKVLGLNPPSVWLLRLPRTAQRLAVSGIRLTSDSKLCECE